MNANNHDIEGGCTCGHVRYQVMKNPMIVHGCHCRGCQKNSGSAFAINALVEADQVRLTMGTVEETSVPTPSGTGQDITRCKKCKVAIWSNYNLGGLRKQIRFIRVGTLDDPDQFQPDVHIYASSKQPWVILPEDSLSVDGFYELNKTWTAASLKRLRKIEETAGIKIS